MDTRTLSGLKSHDCHVLLERFLPTGIWKHLDSEVVETMIYLNSPINCCKILQKFDVDDMKKDIVYILHWLEQTSTSIFTSMAHVMIHLPYKAKLVGLVIIVGCIQLRSILSVR